MHLMLSGSRKESLHKLARLVEIAFLQPVIRHRRLEPDVVPPAEPRIALKNVSHFMKRNRRLLVISLVRAVDAAIDQRIRLGLHHVMQARNVNSLFVVLVRRLEIVKLAINPADTVWKPRMPEEIAIPTRLVEGVIRGCERSR